MSWSDGVVGITGIRVSYSHLIQASKEYRLYSFIWALISKGKMALIDIIEGSKNGVMQSNSKREQRVAGQIIGSVLLKKSR